MPELSNERLVKDAHRVLKNPFWIPKVEAGFSYERLHDDNDGTNEGNLRVFFLSNGDAIVSTCGPGEIGPSLRFRTFGGGGASPHTRNALMLLAEAIRLDNEEK